GQARMRAIRSAGLGRALDTRGLAAAGALAERLAGEARDALAEQGARAGGLERRLYLSYAEADAALAVPLGDIAPIRAGFEAAHRRLFGFIEPERSIVIASVEVEASESSSPPRRGAGSAGLSPQQRDRSRGKPSRTSPSP